MNYGIPTLRRDRLYADVPTELFVWRSASLAKANGATIAFYVDDYRFECLWREAERYTKLFLQHHVAALIEPDFSLWTDMAFVEQLWNIYRTRWLGRYWQEHGLCVIPSLSWSDERSFTFCFQGVPVGCYVVAVECRTASASVDDRRGFVTGLTEAICQVQPQNIVIYGGTSHADWLVPALPSGTQFHLLDSWQVTRRKQRKAARERNQLELFSIRRAEIWADAEAQAV